MPYINVEKDNAKSVQLYYEDLGTGKPVIFISGWPLSSSMWEYQLTQLNQKGLRCITYDRRGFGKSDWPVDGYEYDTLTSDLKALIDSLNTTDITLVGFSMGGGEIARYFAMYGGEKIAKVVLISAVLPYMLQTDENPNGVPQEAFDKMLHDMMHDRPTFFESFNKDFYGDSVLHNTVTNAYLANSLTATMNASPLATIGCAKAFSSTDFRKDVPKINVPTLVIHGDEDKTVPIKATGEKTAAMIANSIYKVYEGAPHGLWFTEKDKLNKDLIDFI
jgi:non-heme chloroperoxidase